MTTLQALENEERKEKSIVLIYGIKADVSKARLYYFFIPSKFIVIC